MATAMGISPTTVQKVVKETNPPDDDGMILVGACMGLDGKTRPNRRVDTTARDDEILRRRASGESIRQIAEAVGCSVGTVHRILKP